MSNLLLESLRDKKGTKAQRQKLQETKGDNEQQLSKFLVVTNDYNGLGDGGKAPPATRYERQWPAWHECVDSREGRQQLRPLTAAIVEAEIVA